jgi:hypothetical protein
MNDVESEPLAAVLERTNDLVDYGPVVCHACRRIGGTTIDGLCGRCHPGVNR